MRFRQRHRDDDALAGRQAVGLDDDRRAFTVDVGMCCGRLGESLEFRGRDEVAGHEALGEILGGFELGGFPGRAEDLQAAGAEDVDDAGSERRFGADHGEVYAFALGEGREGDRVDEVDVLQPGFAFRSGVAGGNVNSMHAFRLGEAPGHRMLAAAGTDYQYLHWERSFSGLHLHHCRSHGMPSLLPSIFVPGQFLRNQVASSHEVILLGLLSDGSDAHPS